MCIMNDEALYRNTLRFTDKTYNRMAKTKLEERGITLPTMQRKLVHNIPPIPAAYFRYNPPRLYLS